MPGKGNIISVRVTEKEKEFLKQYTRRESFTRHEDINISDIVREMLNQPMHELMDKNPDCLEALEEDDELEEAMVSVRVR